MLKRSLPMKLLSLAVVVLLVACGSNPQKLILGKWEAENAVKITIEFKKNGAAMLTMFGQTLRGNYRLNGDHELEWTMNGRTTKSKVTVTANELELTGDTNLTIKYKRI